jgi:hypothetical protein
VNISLSGSWTGGVTHESLKRALHEGDTTYVPHAERVLDEIMRGMRLETLSTQWIADMAGAYPDVPAFLAGDPSCMRRKVIATREIAPMKLFISMSSSAGVGIETLTKRGICLLALVIALSRVRPIELYTFNAVHYRTWGGGRWENNYDPFSKKRHDTIISKDHQRLVDLVQLPTAPLDLGLISFCLVNQGFTRGMCYSYLNKHDGAILSCAPTTDLAECRLICGAEDPDVVFPPIHLHDEYSNPVAWVKKKLQQILDLNEEQVEALQA